MAIMSRRKKAIAAGWNAINKQREEETKKVGSELGEEEISADDHEERLKKLRELGLIK